MFPHNWGGAILQTPLSDVAPKCQHWTGGRVFDFTCERKAKHVVAACVCNTQEL